MTQQPQYDFMFIVPFGILGAFCLWSIYWNCIVFDLPIDRWGVIVGVIGLIQLGGTTKHIVSTHKLRKNYVWEVLKNERNSFNKERL